MHDVNDLDLALWRHHQVCALDVAMDNALFVGSVESLRRLNRDVESVL